VREAEKLSLEAIGRFVEASEEIRFESENRQQVYGWVEQVLVEQPYAQRGKAARGQVGAALHREDDGDQRFAGDAADRTVHGHRPGAARGQVRPTVYRRRSFPRRYTRADIELPASVDEAPETLSGPATRRILERERQLHGKQEYTRLAAISVAHPYNLRRSRRYRERRLNCVKTRPTAVSIGASPILAASPATCVWTRCTRASSRKPRACFISTLSTKSRSGSFHPTDEDLSAETPCRGPQHRVSRRRI
jgi:hypothetical protein